MSLDGFDSHLEKDLEDSGKNDLYWVIVYDNEYNTFDQVIYIIQKATCCSYELAEHIAQEIHVKGKSKVMIALREDANIAADLISSIGIRVEISKVS